MVENGSQPSGESHRVPEAKHTAEQVKNAFEWSFSVFENTPDEKLTDSQKAARDLVKEVKQKTLDKGRVSFLNIFKDREGNTFRQYESLPVDDLIDYLTQRIESRELNETDQQLYEQNRTILIARSFDFYRSKGRATPARLHARVWQEYERVRSDPRLSSGDPDEDWIIAAGRLTKRRELVIPRKTSVPPLPKPKPVPVIPGPVPVLPTPPEPVPTPPDPPEPVPVPEPDDEDGATVTPEKERMFDFMIANHQAEASLEAHREARNKVNDMLRNGKFWQVWHWPRKIGLRLVEGGVLQHQKDRIVAAMVKNNTTCLKFNEAGKTAAELVSQRQKGQLEQQAVVERLKLKTSEGLEQTGEKKIVAQGELRSTIIQEIIKPVTDGAITNSDQVREKLAEFVKSHISDPQIQELFGPQANDFGDMAEYFATDVLEMGLALKSRMEASSKSLDQIDNYININLGYAKAAASTETRDVVDRAVAWAKRRRSQALASGAKTLGAGGVVLNPLVVGVAASLATQGLMRSAGYAGRAAQVPALFVGAGAGAVVAGARRYYELGVYDLPAYRIGKTYGGQAITEESVKQRLQQAKGLGGALGRLAARPLGAYRESDLEKFSYNLASSDQLLKGGGEDLLMPGVSRKSVEDLLKMDLSNADNRLQLVRRIAEIESRWRFSVRERVDLITYKAHEQAQQERLNLDKSIVELHSALGNAGVGQDAVKASIDSEIAKYETRFLQNKQQQDRSFQVYRLRNAAGAAAFGGVMGLVGGVASQQVLKEIAEHIPRSSELPVIGGIFKKGPTQAENLVYQTATTLGHPEVAAPPVSIDTFKNLAQNPSGGTVELGNKVRLVAYANKDISLFDETTNNFIDLKGKVFLEQNGHLIYTGRPDQLPANLRSIFEQYSPADTLDHSFRGEIKQAVESGQPKTVRSGDFSIEINGNKISLLDIKSGQRFNGGVTDSANFSFRLESGDEPAIQSTQNKLKDLGFNVGDTAKTETEIPNITTKLMAFLKEGKGGHFSFNGIDFDYDPKTGDVVYRLGASELHAAINAQTGEIVIDQAKNPGLDHQKLQQIQEMFKKSGFGAELGQNPVESDFSKLGPLQKDLTVGHETRIPAGTEWIKDKSDPSKFDLIIKGQPDKVLINDAKFDPDGKMRFSSAGSLLSEASIKQIDSTFRGIETRDVLGLNGEWEKFKTSIDERQWYAYNTPVSEKNELTLHTFKEGKDTVTLDMSKMKEGFQKGLKPNPIDVQKVIADKQSVFVFTVPGHGTVIVEDGADGVWDGKLKLNPNDIDPNHVIKVTSAQGKILTMPLGEFSKIVLNQEALKSLEGGDIATELYNRQDVFKLGLDGKMGSIEAGRMVINQDGKKVFQSFATILGKDPAGGKVDVEVVKPGTIPAIEVSVQPSTEFLHAKPPEIPIKTTYAFNSTPPTAIDFTPLAEPEAPPIIPTPFSPRHPLRELEQPFDYIYYGYFEQVSEDRKKMFERNRSKTLNENPNARLDPYKEVETYFERQDPEYLQEIKALSGQISEPMNDSVRAVVCIPVAGHEEGEHIYDTLQNYTYQNTQKDQFEILLFVNNPEGTRLDKTISEIKRFKKDYPDMPVKMFYKQIPQQQAKMAVVRKYLNDVALYRHHARGETAKDIILISNDADLKGVSPEYVSNFIEKLDNNETIDGLVGQLDWDPSSYVEYPAIHAGTRLFQYLNLATSRGQRTSSGANFAFKGSIYAGIGGYQINERAGAEDVILGQAIRDARKGDQTLGYAGARVSRLYTSSRRAIDAWNKGISPVEQWEKNWRMINEDIRRIKLGEHKTVNYDDPQQLELLKSDLEIIINRTLEYYGSGTTGKEKPLYKKSVELLGIHYGVNSEGKVNITDMSKFVEGIKDYQKRGILLYQIKSGKIPKDSLKTLRTAVAPASEPIPQVPAPVETAPARPKTLVEKVNETLTGTSESTMRYDVTSEEFVEYVKTVKLPVNSTFKEVNIQIVNNQLLVDGLVTTRLAGLIGIDNKLRAELRTDLAGRLTVVDYELNLNTAAERFRPQIEGYILNLNQVLTEQVNKQINSSWQVESFQIENGKIRFNFKKRTAP